jgi:hypothetical protein
MTRACECCDCVNGGALSDIIDAPMLRRAEARAGVLSSASVADADADDAMTADCDDWRRVLALPLRCSLAALVGVSKDKSESATIAYFEEAMLSVSSSPWPPLPLRVRVTLAAIGDCEKT